MVVKCKMSTNSLSLYSELGRYPLFIEKNIRIVKYFLKLYEVKHDIEDEYQGHRG